MLKPVQLFLTSKRRRSENTAIAYLTALVHFNNFISPETAETILLSLKGGKTNVDELLDLFLTHLTGKVTERSIKQRLAAVISYLVYHDVDINPRRLKSLTIPRPARL